MGSKLRRCLGIQWENMIKHVSCFIPTKHMRSDAKGVKDLSLTSYASLGFSVSLLHPFAVNNKSLRTVLRTRKQIPPDPHSRRVESGTGGAFVLKQSSYRPEGWQHLMLEGLKVFIAPGRIWRWTWWTLLAVARVDSLWVKHDSNLGFEAKFYTVMIYKMAIGACYSHHYSLAKWIIVKCRTTRWLFVNLCCFPCKDKCDLFWRCFQFTPYPCSMPSNPKRCMSLRGVLMNSGDMVLHHFATLETRLWHVVAN